MGRPSHVLRGKVAVIMDGTEGAGPLIAASLAQAGAAITLCGTEMVAVESLYQQFAGIPGVEVLGAACQGHLLHEVHAVAEQTMDRFGRLDIWINYAAVGGRIGPTHELPAEALQALIDRHLLATLQGTRAALAQMLPRRTGKIINVVNTVSTSPLHAAAQAAALRFTQEVAEEYREHPLSILALVAPKPEVGQTEVGEWIVELSGAKTEGVSGRVYEVGGAWWHSLQRWFRGGK